MSSHDCLTVTLVLCEPHAVDDPAASIGAFQHVYPAGFAGIEPCDMDELLGFVSRGCTAEAAPEPESRPEPEPEPES
jgi:hypothetical protein